MRILGIDPGMAIVGYGLIEVEDNNITLVTSGSIQTDKSLSDSKRLLEIYEDMSELVKEFKPDCASVEQLFFFKNQKTIIPVAEARGVILTVLEKFNIPAHNYTPMEVKQVLTGYGRADKKEVDAFFLPGCQQVDKGFILLEKLEICIQDTHCPGEFPDFLQTRHGIV